MDFPDGLVIAVHHLPDGNFFWKFDIREVLKEMNLFERSENDFGPVDHRG